MSDGQVKEAEGAKDAAQINAAARQEAQEENQKVKLVRDPFFDKTYEERHAINGYDVREDHAVRADAYDAQDDAEAIKLWLWYR